MQAITAAAAVVLVLAIAVSLSEPAPAARVGNHTTNGSHVRRPANWAKWFQNIDFPSKRRTNNKAAIGNNNTDNSWAKWYINFPKKRNGRPMPKFKTVSEENDNDNSDEGWPNWYKAINFTKKLTPKPKPEPKNRAQTNCNLRDAEWVRESFRDWMKNGRLWVAPMVPMVPVVPVVTEAPKAERVTENIGSPTSGDQYKWTEEMLDNYFKTGEYLKDLKKLQVPVAGDDGWVMGIGVSPKPEPQPELKPESKKESATDDCDPQYANWIRESFAHWLKYAGFLVQPQLQAATQKARCEKEAVNNGPPNNSEKYKWTQEMLENYFNTGDYIRSLKKQKIPVPGNLNENRNHPVA